jgi:hypothetical protein
MISAQRTGLGGRDPRISASGVDVGLGGIFGSV